MIGWTEVLDYLAFLVLVGMFLYAMKLRHDRIMRRRRAQFEAAYREWGAKLEKPERPRNARAYPDDKNGE